jgi:hypothetical protein
MGLSIALAIALLLPNTPAGKAVRKLLIDGPARQLAKLTPARIVFGIVMMGAIAGLIVFAKTDGLMLIAQTVPEAIFWFATLDVATYLDVVGLLLLMAATIKMRAALQASFAVAARSWRWLMRGAKRLPFSRHRAVKRHRRPRKIVPRPSNEDDRGWCAPAYA